MSKFLKGYSYVVFCTDNEEVDDKIFGVAAKPEIVSEVIASVLETRKFIRLQDIDRVIYMISVASIVSVVVCNSEDSDIEDVRASDCLELVEFKRMLAAQETH